jgi:hypothetical protein
MNYPKKVKSICVPLDPDDCGSVISGYVRYPELYRYSHGLKLWSVNHGASVTLSDCNRVIQWSLSDDGYNFAKIDAAISALTKLRQYMVEAEADLKRAREEKKERNIKLDPKSEDDND